MKLHFKLFDVIPARLNVAVMMFFACWVNYMLRVNMSVNIIAMVPDDNAATAVKSECKAIIANDSEIFNATVLKRELKQPDGVTTFTWTAQEQAYVLSGYFWGYAITCLLGGTAAEFWGPRKLVFVTMMICSLLTILSPQAARWHYLVLTALRFAIGLASGFLFPALHALVAHWAPPDEKGKFVSALLGGAIGTVVTWSLTGPLIENFGWDYAFYVPGVIAVLWCAFWWFLVYDSPLQHPRITEDEKQYIIEAIGDKVQQSSKENKVVPPFKKIFTSFPFLAMVVLHYGSNWGLYFMMTAAPKFVSSALGFDLTSAGTLASLPYLARMIFSVIFGAIGDRIIKQNKVSTTFMRKFFCLFSHVVPGLLLIALGYTGCAPILSIALISFSMGSNGAATLTNLVNHQDLAPNYAATLYGIANGIGNTAGFVTPLVTAHFTKHGGFLFPALHALVAHWAPPDEKGKFVSALLGGAIGTVVTWSLTGPLIENFGWDYAFYVPGVIAVLWCAFWWFLVYDSPLQHPRITEDEKQYIIEAIGDKVQQSSKENKVVPPFKKIFTSFPFLAMVVLHYGSNWGLYFMMTAAPKFVSSALGFDLTSAGTLASLPYLARMIFSVIFGAIGDRIIKQNKVSTTFMRKFFCLFSHVVPGLLLIALGYTGCAPILSIALISFSMGSNGAATLTNLVNHQDLAPNYAATLYGIANGIGNTAGFVTPLVTAHFTKHGNGFSEWRPVFITGASLYIASAGYFILFGTAETQSWNYVTVEEDKRPPVLPTTSQPSSSDSNSTDTTVTIPVKT